MEQNPIAQVFAAHLTLIGTDVQAWSDLLAEDASVEFPYASPTKNSDILSKPLNPSTVVRIDINVNEGLDKMSGFVVTALGSPSRLEGKLAIYDYMKNAVAQLQNWVFTDVREYQLEFRLKASDRKITPKKY